MNKGKSILATLLILSVCQSAVFAKETEKSSKNSTTDSKSVEKGKEIAKLLEKTINSYQNVNLKESMKNIDILVNYLNKKELLDKLNSIRKSSKYSRILPQVAELIELIIKEVDQKKFNDVTAYGLQYKLGCRLLNNLSKTLASDNAIFRDAESLLKASVSNLEKTEDKKKLAEAQLKLATVYRYQNRFEDSQKLVTRAMKGNLPADTAIGAHRLLLELLILQDKHFEYEEEFAIFKSTWNDKKPRIVKESEAYYYLSAKEYDKAESSLLKLKTEKGDLSDRVKLNLAELYMKTGRFKASRNYLESVQNSLVRGKPNSLILSRRLEQLEKRLVYLVENESGTKLIGMVTYKISDYKGNKKGFGANPFGVVVGELIKSKEGVNPASRAGFKLGDLIKSVDKTVATTPKALNSYINSIRANTTLKFNITRDGKKRRIKVKFKPKYVESTEDRETRVTFDNSRKAIVNTYLSYAKACSQGDVKRLNELLANAYFAGESSSTKADDIDQVIELKKMFPDQSLNSIVVDVKGKDNEAVVKSIDLFRANRVQRAGGIKRRVELEAYLLANNYFKYIDGNWKIVAIKNIDSYSKLSFGNVFDSTVDISVDGTNFDKGTKYKTIIKVDYKNSKTPKITPDVKCHIFRKLGVAQESSRGKYKPLKDNAQSAEFTASKSDSTETLQISTKFLDKKSGDLLGFLQVTKLVPTKLRNRTFENKLKLAFSSKEVLNSTKNEGRMPAMAKSKDEPLEPIFKKSNHLVISSLQELARQNNLKAQIALGNYYFRNYDFDDSAFYFQKAAESGSPHAQVKMFEISKMDLKEKVVSEDEGINYIESAIKQHYPQAMVTFAQTMNYKSWQRRALLEEAAALGSIPAKAELGYMYLYGMGVKRNPSKGLTYLDAAIKKKYGPAEYQLAIYHFQKALDWLYKASNHGNEEAQTYLDKLMKVRIIH